MSERSQKSVVLAGMSPSARDAIQNILSPKGVGLYESDSLEDCRERLAKMQHRPLIVVELDGDGKEELQFLAEIRQQYPQSLVLILVDRGDIRTAVQAMKTGACDCLEIPVEAERLKEALEKLLDNVHSRSSANPLTAMEITVLRHILEGETSRQIADALYRSPRTIEMHRRHIMRKLGVSTVVDLVKAVSARGLLDGP